MKPTAAESDENRQLRLVKKSILSGVTGCFEWHEAAMRRARENPDFQGVEPREIKREAVGYVRNNGRILQRKESDEEWLCQRKFDFWYGLCFEIPGLDDPVFLKIVLLQDDDDLPESLIVGSHTSKK